MNVINIPRGYGCNSKVFQQIASSQYNAVDWCRLQGVKSEYYSFIPYPTAGASTLTFFGQATGAVSSQFTNIPKANSFGQRIVFLQSISVEMYIYSENLAAWAGTDATTLFADKLLGLAAGGVFTFKVADKEIVKQPMPLYTMPRNTGTREVYSTGYKSIALTEAAPNTFPAATPSVGPVPFADFTSKKNQNGYLVNPQKVFLPETNFTVNIDYPSGAIPIIATTIAANTTAQNTLYIGVRLKGQELRPVQ